MPLATFEKELSKSNWHDGNLPACEYFRNVSNAASPGGFVEARGASADAKQAAASRPTRWLRILTFIDMVGESKRRGLDP